VRRKLRAKGADLTVGNRVDREDSGFGTSINTVHVADIAGREERWTALPKTEIAQRICSWLLTL
jgi:phosphopantothenoylcysteine decarboxylase/phosphopantothenate--cysteine ligase